MKVGTAVTVGMAVEGGNAVYGFANVEAGSMWMGNPGVFEMAARDWTRMYA